MMSLTEGEMLTNLNEKPLLQIAQYLHEHCYDSAEREFHSKNLNDENCAHD